MEETAAGEALGAPEEAPEAGGEAREVVVAAAAAAEAAGGRRLVAGWAAVPAGGLEEA